MNGSYDRTFDDALAIIRAYRVDLTVAETRDWVTLARNCLTEYEDPVELIQGLAGLFRIVEGLLPNAPEGMTFDQLLSVAYDSAIELGRRQSDSDDS